MRLLHIFKFKKDKNPKEYKGLSDFLLNASDEEKKKVMIDAAHKANEDQFKIFHKAQLKTTSN